MVDAWLSLDVDRMRITQDGITRDILRAGKGSVADATAWLERRLEEATRAAVPGRLWRAWASEVYPKGSRIARDPAGQVYVNGGPRSRGAMEFVTGPGRIAGRSGNWLAIPTAAAGSQGRQRNLTPGEWERQTGLKLRFVYRRGKSALLVADMGITSGRSGVFRPITRKRTAADQRRGYVRGQQTVIIFILVPYVPFKNSVAIGPLVTAAGARLVGDFDSRLSTLR